MVFFTEFDRTMPLHQTRITVRSLLRNKTYTSLNIIGLTSGLIVFLLITQYVRYEFSYDNYHEKKDRIYRVYKEDAGNYYQGTNKFAVIPAPLAGALVEEFPEVVTATAIDKDWNTIVRANDEVFMESTIHSADPSIFDIFSLEVLVGSREHLLQEPRSAVLSESTARKYFDRIDVIGETIRFRDEIDFQVSGVIKDMPGNSHFVMNIILNFQGLLEAKNRPNDNWSNSSYYCFILLNDPLDAQRVQAKMPQIRAKYADDPIESEEGQESQYYVQPLDQLHFTKDVNFDIAPSADARSLYLYLGIAFMILFIAAINYVNLATARAMNRTREIGVRKVVGAHRWALVGSFLHESTLLVGTSLVVGLIAVVAIMPHFSLFVGKDIPIPLQSGQFWAWIVALGTVMTLLSGIYPALILSRFKVVPALKGTKVASNKVVLRNALVVFQFTVSCALILGASVLNDQLNYIQNMDTGFTRDQIVIIQARDATIREKLGIFKDELRKVAGVTYVSSSNSLPNNISSNSSAKWPGRPDGLSIPLYTNVIDYDYVDLFELEVVDGRQFKRELDRPQKSMLLNESAVEALGWEDPIGRQMITWFGDTARIVGILKDFHQHSVHLPIEPAQFFLHETRGTISIKIAGEHLDAALKGMEEAYLSFEPAYPYEYKFFNDIFDKAYQSEINTARLAEWFTILAIVIACLGLYGLAAHRVQHRIKEIGVRKVLGASVVRILLLLTKDFGLLLILAFVIAAPIAWQVMQNWLSDFAYHVEINWFSFVLAFAMMMIVAGLTVGYRTFRAAASNPVEALREE